MCIKALSKDVTFIMYGYVRRDYYIFKEFEVKVLTLLYYVNAFETNALHFFTSIIIVCIIYCGTQQL